MAFSWGSLYRFLLPTRSWPPTATAGLWRGPCPARNPSCSSQPKSKGLFVSRCFWYGPKNPLFIFLFCSLPQSYLSLSLPASFLCWFSLGVSTSLCQKKKKVSTLTTGRKKKEQWSKGLYNWGRKEPQHILALIIWIFLNNCSISHTSPDCHRWGFSEPEALKRDSSVYA